MKGGQPLSKALMSFCISLMTLDASQLMRFGKVPKTLSFPLNGDFVRCCDLLEEHALSVVTQLTLR